MSNWEFNYSNYFGMRHNIYLAVKSLLEVSSNHTIITVQGKKGMGKTRFMNEVAQHLNHREFFKEGIFYFDLNGVHDIGQIQLL